MNYFKGATRKDMKLFRGYIATSNKKSKMKFAHGEKLLTLEQAETLPEYSGVLADDIVLVDIDNDEQSETLMDIVEALQINTVVYQTTRGRHFYFKNTKINKCSTHSKLAIGLEADIKIGLKNSYAVLKKENQKRFIEWDSETLDELPSWLLPVKTENNFYKMNEGDGRNETLFSYILTLQKTGLSKDEIKYCFELLNKYILAKPLSKSELETITRDEAFVDNFSTNNFFTDKGVFKFDVFAKYLVENFNIKRINGQLHIYKDGVYIYGMNEIQSEMIDKIPNLNRQKRAEVLAYLELLIKKDTRISDAEFIAFNNGLYNIETGDFTGFNPEIIITNKINYDYKPESYSELADNVLNKLACNNLQIRMLLEETIGYTFYRRNELRKAFILVGDKHNGKSTYLDMIMRLLGEENTVALDLKELSDRFKPAELFNKLANIGDDIGDEFIGNPAVFKKIVSGDRINVERKGQNPFNFNPYAKMLFSANSIPRIKDKSGAVIDRLVIIPFEASFTKDAPDYDPYIKYKLREDDVMEYLIVLGLNGLKRVLDNQAFTISEKVESNLQEYAENNNPVLLFFKENDDDNTILNRPTKFVYQNYVAFCLSNNFQQLSNIEFSKQVKKRYGYEIKVKTINGKSTRCFC